MGIDFSSLKRVHIIGIKGWGTRALAQLLAYQGITVCGSDYPNYFPSEEVLSSAGISVEPFAADNIHAGIECVVYSTAYSPSNPERVRARERGTPCISYAEAIGALFAKKEGIAVCGTHGKTTTSALLAFILHDAGLSPTAVIGSKMTQFPTNVLLGSSRLFVLEADEYQNKMQYYEPKHVLLTSVEWDHPDFFPSEREYKAVFADFLSRSSLQTRVACMDDKGVSHLCKNERFHNLLSYGSHHSYDYSFDNYSIEQGLTRFTIMKKGKKVIDATLGLIGKHNVLNAVGVFALLDHLSLVSPQGIAKGIAAFKGTERRFEYKGVVGKTQVFVDYGHHPTEIAVTLGAVRERFAKQRIWCVFGAHTFSRTEKLFVGFSKCFSSVDKVLLLDIYGSAREQNGSIHSRDVAEAVQAESHNALYTGTIEKTVAELKDHAAEIDILICMGASEDVWKTAERFLNLISPKNA